MEIINRIRIDNVTVNTLSALVLNRLFFISYPSLDTISVETFFAM